jgi:hypothetical protein
MDSVAFGYLPCFGIALEWMELAFVLYPELALESPSGAREPYSLPRHSLRKLAANEHENVRLESLFNRNLQLSALTYLVRISTFDSIFSRDSRLHFWG